MTDAPALSSLQDDATVTPRTDREVYTIRQQDIGFEAVGATLARTLERELAAAIADRNAPQLAFNAANGRADGLEVAINAVHAAEDAHELELASVDTDLGARLFDLANEVTKARQAMRNLSTIPESPYLVALREYFAAMDVLTTVHENHDSTVEDVDTAAQALDAAEQRCRPLLADPQPDTKGQRIEEPKL